MNDEEERLSALLTALNQEGGATVTVVDEEAEAQRLAEALSRESVVTTQADVEPEPQAPAEDRAVSIAQAISEDLSSGSGATVLVSDPQEGGDDDDDDDDDYDDDYDEDYDDDDEEEEVSDGSSFGAFNLDDPVTQTVPATPLEPVTLPELPKNDRIRLGSIALKALPELASMKSLLARRLHPGTESPDPSFFDAWKLKPSNRNEDSFHNATRSMRTRKSLVTANLLRENLVSDNVELLSPAAKSIRSYLLYALENNHMIPELQSLQLGAFRDLANDVFRNY